LKASDFSVDFSEALFQAIDYSVVFSEALFQVIDFSVEGFDLNS
jgi:hypothetical protein